MNERLSQRKMISQVKNYLVRKKNKFYHFQGNALAGQGELNDQDKI